MRAGWNDALAREGLAPVAPVDGAEDSEHPACPACGTAAALVDGACSDCGLMLG
ncbi:MAG: hypothetical protein IPI49_32990 [Myxococcales bacterium]|nr:hypothetical protein [Myxococcales bacterium]